MISESSLFIISFINCFLVPLIGVRIYCRRHNIEWKASFELLYKYVLFCVLNLIVARGGATVIENIVEITIVVESIKYTVISFVSTVFLPYCLEVIEKFFQIKVTIYKVERDEKKNED